MAFRDRRIWAILGLAGALCGTSLIAVRVQETIAGRAGACPDKTAPFVEPLNQPIGTDGASIPRSIGFSPRRWRESPRRTCRASS